MCVCVCVTHSWCGFNRLGHTDIKIIRQRVRALGIRHIPPVARSNRVVANESTWTGGVTKNVDGYSDACKVEEEKTTMNH